LLTLKFDLAGRQVQLKRFWIVLNTLGERLYGPGQLIYFGTASL
jgi:hypothetical protein